MPSSSEQQRLSVGVHLARLVILVTVTLGLVLSVVEASLEYGKLRATLFEHSEQVAKAFQDTATRAIAREDRVLAAQVADGLLEFGPIVSVELGDVSGRVLAWRERSRHGAAGGWLPQWLPSAEHVILLELSPLSNGGELGGYLRVTASSRRAAHLWADQLGFMLLTVLAGTAVLTGVLLVMSQRFISRPMRRLANAFRELDVADPQNSPLPNVADFRFREFREIAENGIRLMRDITRNSEVRDLTSNELYRSQKRLQDFAEISSDWFWESDRDGGITYISPSFTKTLDMKTAAVYGRKIAETTAEPTTTPKWEKFAETQRQRRQFRDFRYDMEVKAGTRKTVSINGRPFYDEDGTFIGYRGTGSDVTNERLIAEARNDALQRAEQASRTKSEFLATMSHEFRTPLNAIIGFSSLLSMPKMRESGPDRIADYSTAIHDSGQHMLALVNDILDISAIEAGKRMLSFGEIEIGTLLSQCLSQVESQARKKGLNLVSGSDLETGRMHSDERSARQILLNLLSNAVKFTPDGGTVRLSAEERDGLMTFRVADTGIGIPEDRLPTIAEPFSHAAIHPHVAKEGTGLGLSIVRSLTLLLDGEFEIESKLGVGTTVTIKLPQNLQAESQSASEARAS